MGDETAALLRRRVSVPTVVLPPPPPPLRSRPPVRSRIAAGDRGSSGASASSLLSAPGACEDGFLASSVMFKTATGIDSCSVIWWRRRAASRTRIE